MFLGAFAVLFRYQTAREEVSSGYDSLSAPPPNIFFNAKRNSRAVRALWVAARICAEHFAAF